MATAPQTPKEFRLWEDRKNWIDRQSATRFIPEALLEHVPRDAKFCIIPGGEIADCFLYNDFRGGIHVLINDRWREDGGVRWHVARNADDAFQLFLEKDHGAS
jgi:hypothetical protein